MKQDDIIQIKITDMLDDGRGFGRKDNFAVFVDGGVIGDTVLAKITKVKKSVCEAHLLEIIESSPKRVEPLCPYFAECGGCTLQELDYKSQLELKKNQVVSKLERIAGIENPKIADVISAESLSAYRNKATFAMGPHGEVGFYKSKSHFVIDIKDCMLQNKVSMTAASVLRDFFKNSQASSIKQMTVKTAFATGEVMVVLESEKKEIPHIADFIGRLDEEIYKLNSPISNDLQKDENSNASTDYVDFSLESVAIICKNKCSIIAGKPTITDEIKLLGGKALRFEIGPQSFYQVNSEQMPKLYQRAIDYANLTGNETVLDLYCGIGTIGLCMADEAKEIIGIESVKPAVIDANRNAVINNIINARYFAGKAEVELPGMMALSKLYKYNEVNDLIECEPEIKLNNVDVVIVDPPRAGCDEALLNAIVTSTPNRIVYVSCDAGTLARDIKYLTDKGYQFEEATIVDQFPWTSHVESVALLSREKVDGYVDIELDVEKLEGKSGTATYAEIKKYVADHNDGMKVSSLYIGQIKNKMGLEKRKNYNIGSGEGRVPICPQDKEEAIVEAFKHFNLI